MKRILLCVAYDGTNFSGWQLQKGVRTVEGELNKALSELTGEDITVIGASRTDAGVHALANMAVFDTESTIPADRFSFALKTKLPDDVVVRFSREVSACFHPRHMLTEKTYEYHIYNADFMPPQKRLFCHQENRKLDVEAMNAACKYIVGEHDFKSFCAAGSTAETTVRNVISCEVIKDLDEVTVRITGNGFLYNMVRIISGTLIWVGVGLKKPEQVKDIIEACDRKMAGPTAPPQGLCLANFKFCEFTLDTEEC